MGPLIKARSKLSQKAITMDRIAEILIGQFEYDVAVLSQPWMYWLLLIPATAYLAFFFVKWSVLTAPIWIPLMLIFEAVKIRVRLK